MTLADAKSILELIGGSLTPLIAVAVTYIAYRQYRTARARLALDLFDKRMEVYSKVNEAVRVVNVSDNTSREADSMLLEAIAQSAFLFGDDVKDYLDDMWHKFCRLHAAHQMQESSDADTRLKNAKAASEIASEITQFYYEGPDRFAHYMRMDQAHRPPLKTLGRRPGG